MKRKTKAMLVLLLALLGGMNLSAQTCEESCIEFGAWVFSLTGSVGAGIHAATLCVQVEC
jgi:hypothetical protein